MIKGAVKFENVDIRTAINVSAYNSRIYGRLDKIPPPPHLRSMRTPIKYLSSCRRKTWLDMTTLIQYNGWDSEASNMHRNRVAWLIEVAIGSQIPLILAREPGQVTQKGDELPVSYSTVMTQGECILPVC